LQKRTQYNSACNISDRDLWDAPAAEIPGDDHSMQRLIRPTSTKASPMTSRPTCAVRIFLGLEKAVESWIFSDCGVTARGSVEGKYHLTLESRSVTSFSFAPDVKISIAPAHFSDSMASCARMILHNPCNIHGSRKSCYRQHLIQLKNN